MGRRFLFFILFSYAIPSLISEPINTKLISKFPLEHKEPIGRAWGFAVDENEDIYFPDRPFGHIKIFTSEGKLKKVFGKKGAGPNEFVGLGRIKIAHNKICVQDFGLLRYIIYDKEFNELSRFFYLISGGEEFVIDGERLITSGYLRDKDGEFKGIIMDLKGNILKKLMRITYPPNDAWNRITGLSLFVDISEKGDIFFAKSSEVKFYKFTKEGELIKTFGKNPSYFLPPRRTSDFEKMLRWGRAPEGIKAGEDWYSSFSWVSGLFVLKEFLGIAIRRYNKEEKKWDCFLQFYDLDGKILREKVELKEAGDSSYNGFYMDSNHKDRFYILEINDGIDPPRCTFYKYMVKK